MADESDIEQGTDQDERGGEGTEVLDSHGQPGVNREKYRRDLARRDAEIADLKARLDKADADGEERARLRQDMADLEAKWADERLGMQLDAAGCLSDKAAKALLPDYGGDVSTLKESVPWLFRAEARGTTGLPPAGTPSHEARAASARRAAGLD